MSTVTKSTSTVTHQLAGCLSCGKDWQNYKTAGGNARRHTAKTGHKTWVETGTTYTYRALPKQEKAE